MNKLLGSIAGQYTMLLVAGVVGFVIIHSLLKKDVQDTAGALQHPFGQAFDDWFNNLVGGPTTGGNADGAANDTSGGAATTRSQVVTPNNVSDLSELGGSWN